MNLVCSLLTGYQASVNCKFIVDKKNAVFWIIMALSSCHLIFFTPSSDKCTDIFSFCLLFFLPLLHSAHTLCSVPPFSRFVFAMSYVHTSPSVPKTATHSLDACLFYVLSLHPFIPHPSRTTLSISLPLISLPMLWLVSPVSVRPVITAVSSLGKNKVILCSRHYKRQREK